MTKAEIIEVPGPNDWTMELSFDGLQIEFRWRELSYDGRSIGHWGKILDVTTGEELPFNRSDERWRELAIQKAAATLRIAQIRKELNLDQSLPFRTDREFRKSLIIELFERSQRGEYLGQLTGQQIFYVQEVAEIFGTEMRNILELIDELSAEGKIGLNGMILIPHRDQEDTFAHWEKSTGHRRITVGDFGNWGCSACGKWGDEYDSPKDFPCEPPAAPKFPAIALTGTEPEVIAGVPGDGCSCICHQIVGISHIRACCDGSSAVVATEARIEAEQDQP